PLRSSPKRLVYKASLTRTAGPPGGLARRRASLPALVVATRGRVSSQRLLVALERLGSLRPATPRVPSPGGQPRLELRDALLAVASPEGHVSFCTALGASPVANGVLDSLGWLELRQPGSEQQRHALQIPEVPRQ